ncbi:REP-associated tyrosine transposase [Thioalkalivibrio thiocyanodenitrificans]|uniref:REP-associated tyrosine transposase n=1 Tax=Thioalkalivibrio thiocyanodenitrificans TaxID=243063 RepID=UPI000475D3E7|nr:transposase [Thioalkalivibrio thiocyanodenitrificans]
MSRFQGRNLRIGRCSESGRAYLITTVTLDRKPIFLDFCAARMLIKILREEQIREKALTLAFVVMPDHLHWLMQLHGSDALQRVVGRVKSISARRLNGCIWQAGFYDHAVRHEEDLVGLARYVVANPVRAGLVQSARDYPHWDAIWL